MGKVCQDRADHLDRGPGAAVRQLLSELGGLRWIPGTVGPEQYTTRCGTHSGTQFNRIISCNYD